jgi:outer membrane protein OmpA-like peptidoglycan-associated protein
MADLDVQPKKKSGSILPWVLLGLGLLALIIFLARGCNDRTDTTVDDRAAATTDSAGSTVSNATNGAAASVRNWWDDVDFNAPTTRYDEINSKDVDVRGNDRYGIYGVNETVLFDEGKATIRSGAENTLKQIAASISKRYNGGNVRVYGHTDAVGSAGSNKELAEQRAEAVRSWLTKSGNVSEGNVSVHPVGESQPVASNATESGRQQNRRVEIVAGTTAGNAAAGGSDTSGAR